MSSVVQHESNLSLTGERPQARMSSRVRVKVDTLGGRWDGGVSGGKALRLGLKTGEKRRISRHKMSGFCSAQSTQLRPIHSTALLAGAASVSGTQKWSSSLTKARKDVWAEDGKQPSPHNCTSKIQLWCLQDRQRLKLTPRVQADKG